MAHFAESFGANRAVLALSFARLGDAVGNSILFIVIPLYVASLPAPWFPLPESVRAGILIALYGLVSAVIQPFAGAISDRLHRRKIFIQSGLILMGASTLAFVMASRFSDLLVLRALQGIGVALTIPASVALMAASSDRQTRGGSMGIYVTARMGGFTIGPLIGGYLYDRFGFNAAFYCGTAFIALAMILVQIWVMDIPFEAAPARGRPFRIIDCSLLTSGIIGSGIATFVMAGAFSMMTPLEEQFNIRLHESAFGFSIAFSALMVSRLLFQIPFGRLSDIIGRKPLIIAGLILMAPATALLGEVGTTSQLTGLRVMQGLASAAIAAPAFALAADLSKVGGAGRQMSITTMGFGLGIALGPLIAGVLAVFSFHLPFFIGGLLSLAGACFVQRYVEETVHRRGEQS
jgi:MFS family permease